MAFIRKKRNSARNGTVDSESLADSYENLVEGQYSRFYRFVDGLKNPRATAIGASLLAALLVTASSLPFNLPELVRVLVGFPGGVLLFLVGLGLFYKKGSGDGTTSSYRLLHSQKQRASTVAVVGVVLAIILLLSSPYLPYGLGGVIVLGFALSALTIIRKTPEEHELARLGIPDPRDLPDDTEEELLEEETSK